MADTAVGLFEDALVAEAVVDGLRAHGFPPKGIRTVAKPAAVNGATSTGAIDFASALNRDLRSMGASEYECGAYLDGLQRGNVLVFASGTHEQADAATHVMNEFNAVEIEEFATVGAKSPSSPIEKGDLGTINPESRLPESQITIGAHEKSYTSHSSRSKKEGARVFSW
jgi:hypothetical protein